MIQANITDIIPGAGYQGITYDQWLLVSIDNKEIKVFDSGAIAAPDTSVGEECELSLILQPSQINQINDGEVGIVQISEKTTTVVGSVVGWTIREDRLRKRLLELNIGIGIALVPSTSELASFKANLTEGDLLRVSAYRIDLLDIEFVD